MKQVGGLTARITGCGSLPIRMRALYQIDKSRGSKVVGNILGEKYQGVLISDFYSAYNELNAPAKQRCLGHLLSEIEKVQFLDNPLIEPTNNRAERQLMPMVIMRKLTFGNRSDLGALNQAAIMSIVQTGILNDVEPPGVFLALSVKPVTSFIELPRVKPP